MNCEHSSNNFCFACIFVVFMIFAIDFLVLAERKKLLPCQLFFFCQTFSSFVISFIHSSFKRFVPDPSWILLWFCHSDSSSNSFLRHPFAMLLLDLLMLLSLRGAYIRRLRNRWTVTSDISSVMVFLLDLFARVAEKEGYSFCIAVTLIVSVVLWMEETVKGNDRVWDRWT